METKWALPKQLSTGQNSHRSQELGRRKKSEMAQLFPPKHRKQWLGEARQSSPRKMRFTSSSSFSPASTPVSWGSAPHLTPGPRQREWPSSQTLLVTKQREKESTAIVLALKFPSKNTSTVFIAEAHPTATLSFLRGSSSMRAGGRRARNLVNGIHDNCAIHKIVTIY